MPNSLSNTELRGILKTCICSGRGSTCFQPGNTHSDGVYVYTNAIKVVGWTQNEQKVNDRLSHLLTGSSRRGKSEGFLDILSDGHGAEDVEEDEAAVGHIIAQQVPVGQALHPVDRCEGQLGHNATIKYRVEHG